MHQVNTRVMVRNASETGVCQPAKHDALYSKRHGVHARPHRVRSGVPHKGGNEGPLKLVDISEFYAAKGGGVRRYTDDKLRAAARLGVELTIVAPGPETRRERHEGGVIQWIKGPPMPLDPRYYVLHRKRAVHRLLDELDPDVVEGSSVWSAGWFAATYRGRAKKALVFHQDPVAVYPHTLFDGVLSRRKIDAACSPFWRYLQRLSSNFDATVVAGEWLARRLETQGVHRPVAVPFGVTRQAQRVSPAASEQIRRNWLNATGAGTGGRLIVAISRHHPEKRLGTVLDGFARAREELGGRLGLVLFGDGPLRAWVQRRAGEGVVVAGFTSDAALVEGSLRAADVFLHGGAAETYGLVVAEALAAGAPLVVPNVGGAHDLAHPNYAESYVPGDSEGCSAAILRMLRRDPNALRNAVRNVHLRTLDEHFEDLFTRYQAMAGTPIRVKPAA